MEEQYAATSERRVIEWGDVYDTIGGSYTGRGNEGDLNEKRPRLCNDVFHKKGSHLRHQSPEMSGKTRIGCCEMRCNFLKHSKRKRQMPLDGVELRTYRR